MRLERYVEQQLELCTKDPKELYFDSAYGAITSYLWMYHKDNDKIAKRWMEEWKPAFEKMIWGN